MLLNAVSSSMYVLDLCWWTKSMANALQKRKKKGGEGGDGGRGEGKGFIIYLFIVLCGTVAGQRMLKLQSCLKYAWWYSFPNKLLILLVLFGTGCTVGLAKKQLSLLCFISLITPVEITEALHLLYHSDSSARMIMSTAELSRTTLSKSVRFWFTSRSLVSCLIHCPIVTSLWWLLVVLIRHYKIMDLAWLFSLAVSLDKGVCLN